MYVDSIKLINFRNYKKLDVKFNKKLNVFIGKNAQGKTNLLESIYMCSTGKSYRTNRDRDVISINKNKSYIGTKVVKDEYDRFIEIKMEDGKPKRIRVNNVELEKNKELQGELFVVMFSPDDLKLVKEGPYERRNFLDVEISQLSPRYKYDINRYQKILYQRNNLLKSIQVTGKNRSLLDVFDNQISQIGSEIIIFRAAFMKKLALIAKNIHMNITNSLEVLDLSYCTNIEIDKMNKANVNKKLMYMLKQSANEDIMKGSTYYGPHRDDIDININGMNVRNYGSQGQQRTAVLSMKLAEVEFIREEKNEYPILLLDDVFSELDLDRRRYLLNSFKDLQIIMASTDAFDLKEFDDFEKNIYLIENGNIIY